MNNGGAALALTSALNAGANNVNLNAGSITQAAAGVVTADTLSGSTLAATDLTGATNAIAHVGAFTSGGSFSLNDTGTALGVTGALNAGVNTVSLSAASIGQSAAGVITAGTLTAVSAGTINLGAASNAVANVGSTSFVGDFAAWNAGDAQSRIVLVP